MLVFHHLHYGQKIVFHGIDLLSLNIVMKASLYTPVKWLCLDSLSN